MGASVKFDFSGCRVLVTGGSSGIGSQIAADFRQAGASVSITGTRPTAADYDGDLSSYAYHRCRMTEPDDIARVAASLPALDVLVNNAGANLPGGRSEWQPDVFEEVVAINLFGAFRMSVACKALLGSSGIDGGGSIVNLASMSSYFAVPVVPGYGAAKAGVVQMTKNLAVAWVRDGVRVNAVAPGLIESNMTAAMKGIAVLEKPHMDRTPMSRWGTPQDVSPAILFLASPAARFITGQTLPVDGGYSVA